MNRDKREPEYPAELESQFILRLPPEPSRVLREVLKTGDSLKNRLTIQIENDMRHGEVRFEHWLMHAKIVDLPTVVEALKTIDNKSFYKTADIAQMMICKEEADQATSEEESPTKNKKRDPYKVEKKFLWPHGITPPTKNVRKRRFRKTLRKKFVEAPEIEKEVKRLLRADNEAVSVTWEVINEEEEPSKDPIPSTSTKAEKKPKAKVERVNKKEPTAAATAPNPESSNVVDIFGGALSDSDLEEEINVDMENCHLSPYETGLTEPTSMQELTSLQKNDLSAEFNYPMFYPESPKPSTSQPSTSGISNRPPSPGLSSDDESDSNTRDPSKENMDFRIAQVKAELDELRQRRQRTQHEIAGMENMALRQRFQDILHTLNQDIMYKDMEYQGLLTLQNSEVI